MLSGCQPQKLKNYVFFIDLQLKPFFFPLKYPLRKFWHGGGLFFFFFFLLEWGMERSLLPIPLFPLSTVPVLILPSIPIAQVKGNGQKPASITKGG